MTELPSVVTPQERGRRGYEATLRKYGAAQMDRWRRKGGRRRNRTYDEIMAEQAATRRQRRVSSERGGRPSRND